MKVKTKDERWLDNLNLFLAWTIGSQLNHVWGIGIKKERVRLPLAFLFLFLSFLFKGPWLFIVKLRV